MNRLTRQERLVLLMIVSLLVTGWIVRAYRTQHAVSQAEDAKDR
jgi:hypothetical protein